MNKALIEMAVLSEWRCIVLYSNSFTSSNDMYLN